MSHHHHQQPPAAKRPKLSLKTTDTPRACGRSSTGLVFASSIVGAASGLMCHTPTSATASPTTARNTFSNAYAIPGTPVPTSATTATASSLSRQSTTLYPHSPLSTRIPSLLPYQQPLQLRSILRNTPLPTPRRRMTATSSPLFPRTKRVRYADPLAREIRTEVYVQSHYELVVALEEEEGEGKGKGEREREREREREGQDDVEAKTPIRRRGKKREWTWTLGDVGGVKAEQLSGTKRGREEGGDEDGDCANQPDSDSSSSEDNDVSSLPKPPPQPSEAHPNKRRKLHFSLSRDRDPTEPEGKPPPPAAAEK
ncbi:MAG: hypothetical protein M1813_000164 [Trichoglossum hirsutum]|nr:MAG: hypothetical protein M1813_000164 [Trichoglossum hirsutum]